MKLNKIFKNSAWSALAALALTACEPFEYKQADVDLHKDVRPATHTIKELIDELASERGVFPVRSNSGSANLFSVDTIPYGGETIMINGRVVSSDREGNMYKYIIIQDLKDPKQGLKISIDANSLFGLMPIGQVISLQCNGLAIGKYADMYQLGVVYYNDNTDTRKRGYEPGRMPYPIFKKRVQLHGLAEPAKVVADTMTIAEIRAADRREIESRLVVIKDAHFTGFGEVDFDRVELNEDQKYWGLPINTIANGVPISREVTDPSGATINVSTSQYAAFAKKGLPEKDEIGDLTVIIGYYRDKASNTGDFQLNVRSLEDFRKKQ